MTSTSDRSSTSPEAVLAAAHRGQWGRLVSLLVGRTRRLDLVEDALAEAFAIAAQRWPVDGVPANPPGWLYRTAHHQIIGRLRAEAVAGRKAPLLALAPGWTPSEPDIDSLPDDRLHLILLCCHRALSRESQSALALRLVIGTPTDQIARLFLVSTPTMAARLTRAKKKIVSAGIPLGAPVADELRRRLDEVCRTVYLAFTAGYTPGAGPDLVRTDLAGEAVELAGLLHRLVPEAEQVRALLALLLLQHSRRHARLHQGRLVTLADQDRSRWCRDEIRAGLDLVDGLRPGQGYQAELVLQALIAAEHARAPAATATDWAAIARHYAALERLTGSAIVRLNRAVAVAEVDGAAAGLDLLIDLDQVLATSHRLWSVRAELAGRAGQLDLARSSYLTSIEHCDNEVERAHLRSRLNQLGITSGRRPAR